LGLFRSKSSAKKVVFVSIGLLNGLASQQHDGRNCGQAAPLAVWSKMWPEPKKTLSALF
jgi:hypothetical protein